MRMLALTLLLVLGCSTPPSPRGTREAGQITEAQLQDSLFRYANRFSTVVREGLNGPENSSNTSLREQALLRRLVYSSNALDVALGPSPQANLLDMVSFVELSREVWNEYWVPRVFDGAGQAMSLQFNEAYDEIWEIAGKVLNQAQHVRLTQLIKDWRKRHPDQVAVEIVRLSEFSAQTGAEAQAMKDEVGGLLSSVEAATVVGDRALLFSERALFYAQRAPFLWRLQAQVGTHDVLTEAMTTLASTREIQARKRQLHSLLEEMSRTVATGVAGIVKTQTDRTIWQAFFVGTGLLVVLGIVVLISRLLYAWLIIRWGLDRRTRDAGRDDRRAA